MSQLYEITFEVTLIWRLKDIKIIVNACVIVHTQGLTEFLKCKVGRS